MCQLVWQFSSVYIFQTVSEKFIFPGFLVGGGDKVPCATVLSESVPDDESHDYEEEEDLVR